MSNYEKAKDVFIQRKKSLGAFEEYPLIVGPNSVVATNASNDLIMIPVVELFSFASVGSASYANTASWAINAINGGTLLITGSTYPITSSWSENAVNATSSSYLSGSDAIVGTLTVTGLLNATQISGSQVYITSSQLTVTDNILTLNANTPYLRYAGIEMYDSGSTDQVSSFLWDGENNYFFLSSSDGGYSRKIVTGPDNEGDLTSGYITLATSSNGLINSIISQSGNIISIGGSLNVSNLTASLFGTSSWSRNSLTASSINFVAQTATSSSYLSGSGTSEVGGLIVKSNDFTQIQAGRIIPFYMVANWPTLGFNAYYGNGSWRYGTGSISNYGAYQELNPTSGLMTYRFSPTSGNSGGSFTANSIFSMSPTGQITFPLTFTVQSLVQSDGSGNLTGIPITGSIYPITSISSSHSISSSWAPATPGLNGGIFITNITPQSIDDNVSSKTYSSNGIVLESCLSNTNLINVSVVAVVGYSNFIPSATINGTPLTLTGSVNSAILTGSLSLNTAHSSSLVVLHEDGASHTTTITYDVGPAVTSCLFVDGYPGSQTELKESDVFNLQVVTDIPMTRIYVYNEEACIEQTFNFVATLSKTISVVIANRGDITQALRSRVKCMNSNGSYGSAVYSNNTVDLNNTYPSISIGTITYPGSQTALKDSENATVANTVTSFDTITYTSVNGDLSISNSTTYETNKSVTRIGGGYNVNTNNLSISATRTANAATSSSNGLVKIANTLPAITISVPYARLKSGGNDGTAAQDYVVTISSNQLLLSSPVPSLDLGSGGGTWQGSGFAGSGAIWTRTVRISDSMTKGNYSFTNLSAYNLAGKEQTSINAGSAYVLGGFVIRTLNINAFANTTTMNVEAVTYPSKVTMIWTVKSLPTKSTIGTSPPVSGAWTISALNTNPTTVIILDTSATAGSSQLTTLTIEETV